MAYPGKWRETCDPFALAYHAFRPTEVLGYPHAGNDVFHMRGQYEGRDVTAFVKVARQKDANLENEVRILLQLKAPTFPRVLDYDREGFQFSVTEEMLGERLSVIVGENRNGEALSYMEEYGEMLARLHALPVKANRQADRRFHHRPTREALEALGLAYLDEYFANPPRNGETVFCHGDFHYANVLWRAHHISAVLDFELAGYGDHDFDLAWALFLRPGQRFLGTGEEAECFLNGYRKAGGHCDAEAVRYFMAQCYVHFLGFIKDADYCDYVRGWLKQLNTGINIEK